MGSTSSSEKIKITVKRAEPNDAEEIQNVVYKTWLATYPNNVPGVSVDDVREYFKDRLSAEGIEKYQKRIKEKLEFENQRFFVARLDEKIIGICLAFRSAEKNQLKAIYVLPEFQGMGVGYALWNEVLNFIDEANDTTVEVVIHNSKAIEFYKRLGFEDTGRRWANKNFKMKSGAMFPEMELKIKGIDSPK